MITEQKGIRKITLGEGTTYITPVAPKDDSVFTGILFSNKPPIDNKHKLSGDEVIIELANFQGVLSYIKAIVELLKTWNIEGLEEHFDKLDETLRACKGE